MHLTSRSMQLWSVVGTAAAVLVVGFLGSWLGGAAPLVYSLALPLGILFGLVGAFGFAVGNLLRELALGTASIQSLVRLVGDLLLVAIGIAIWADRDHLIDVTNPRALLAGLSVYVSAGAVASLWSVAFVAAGMTLAGGSAFSNSVLWLAPDQVVPVVILGPVVLLGLASVVGRFDASSGPRSRPTRHTLIYLVLVGGGWLAGGIVLSLVHRDIAALPGAGPDLIAYLPAAAGPPALLLIGPLYPLVQTILATIALVIGFRLLADRPTMNRDPSKRRHSMAQ